LFLLYVLINKFLGTAKIVGGHCPRMRYDTSLWSLWCNSLSNLQMYSALTHCF